MSKMNEILSCDHIFKKEPLSLLTTWDRFETMVGPNVASAFQKYKHKINESEYIRLNITVIANYQFLPPVFEENEQGENFADKS